MSNVATSAEFFFNVSVGSQVKPGIYKLQMEVGGVQSNEFTILVTPADDIAYDLHFCWFV